MSKNKNQFQLITSAISILAISLWPYMVLAQSSSTNYRIEESYFGTGGEVDANSASYRARQSSGALGVGNSSSTSYDAVAGATTPSEPFLEMEVTGADVNFGTLSPTTTSYAAAQGGSCNCTFSIRTYLSSEYSVFTVSQSLASENGDVIDAKTVQGAPSGSSSVEEFGINLVDNTASTADMGANPVNEPDNSFADGQAASGYQTPDQYKYTAGNIIASSQATAGNQAVGKTNYTITYMAKISNLSQAGIYTMRHDLVVVPTF